MVSRVFSRATAFKRHVLLDAVVAAAKSTEPVHEFDKAGRVVHGRTTTVCGGASAPLPPMSEPDRWDPGEPQPRQAPKKPWRKPTITAIWDELMRVESGPGPSGPGHESPTYTHVSS